MATVVDDLDDAYEDLAPVSASRKELVDSIVKKKKEQEEPAPAKPTKENLREKLKNKRRAMRTSLPTAIRSQMMQMDQGKTMKEQARDMIGIVKQAKSVKASASHKQKRRMARMEERGGGPVESISRNLDSALTPKKPKPVVLSAPPVVLKQDVTMLNSRDRRKLLRASAFPVAVSAVSQ